MSPSVVKVMVVEDDRALADLVVSVLEEEGYAVQTARNGQEALNQVRESLPDIILLDLQMPVMDGWTFYSLLRQHKDTATIPVIVTSSDEREARARSDLHAECFLQKPFEIDDLLIKIKNHLP